MAARLCAHDVAYFYEDHGVPQLFLAMNDTFGYACGDAEEVPWADIPAVYALWKQHGHDGLISWVWKRRGTPPLKEILATMPKELHVVPEGKES